MAIALSIRACLAGHRVRFATATQWVARLQDAKRDGRLEDELATLGRIPVLVIDEIGYIPFDPQAANLMFALVSSRYERASMIVTSNKPFSRWGEIFGDDVVAAAMIDRLVHHAEILSLKGDSYRLKGKDLGLLATGQAPRNRLTDRPRAAASRPQNAAQHAAHDAEARQTLPNRLGERIQPGRTGSPPNTSAGKGARRST